MHPATAGIFFFKKLPFIMGERRLTMIVALIRGLVMLVVGGLMFFKWRQAVSAGKKGIGWMIGSILVSALGLLNVLSAPLV
jgi:hypothetical protein